ncbi:hypothetical protein HYALB_00012259 [Hymenoscyphus albidus]|uniref:Uncharacterized protein n=1 Tax=Hymenoscyphus albidus TaxID=595503 RepID=A0A9N9Q9G9_9HELO|nr:hypothetical protein HYALB_00012259 [Hymenoscyphus albidus]
MLVSRVIAIVAVTGSLGLALPTSAPVPRAEGYESQILASRSAGDVVARHEVYKRPFTARRSESESKRDVVAQQEVYKRPFTARRSESDS